VATYLIVSFLELAEDRVSQVFLQAIEMGEMYSREVAVTLGESSAMLIRVAMPKHVSAVVRAAKPSALLFKQRVVTIDLGWITFTSHTAKPAAWKLSTTTHRSISKLLLAEIYLTGSPSAIGFLAPILVGSQLPL
jgi:hypothetical protein